MSSTTRFEPAASVGSVSTSCPFTSRPIVLRTVPNQIDPSASANSADTLLSTITGTRRSVYVSRRRPSKRTSPPKVAAHTCPFRSTTSFETVPCGSPWSTPHCCAVISRTCSSTRFVSAGICAWAERLIVAWASQTIAIMAACRRRRGVRLVLWRRSLMGWDQRRHYDLADKYRRARPQI